MLDDLYPSGIGNGEPGPAGHPDQHFCVCGSAWFEGAVLAFERDGSINGRLGFLRCIECGAPIAEFESEAS